MGANEPETVTIFHLHRRNGQSVFLHPFDNSRRLVDTPGNVPIEGRYGKEPETGAFTLFRDRLYRMIDDGLWSWAGEIHGIPRSRAGGAVFLSVYLAPTIVLRNRVPLWTWAAAVFGVASTTAAFAGIQTASPDSLSLPTPGWIASSGRPRVGCAVRDRIPRCMRSTGKSRGPSRRRLGREEKVRDVCAAAAAIR